MPSANGYRELTDKCFKSARVAHTEDERMMYLALAHLETARCQLVYHRRPG
jgi:hypothetical protein